MIFDKLIFKNRLRNSVVRAEKTSEKQYRNFSLGIIVADDDGREFIRFLMEEAASYYQDFLLTWDMIGAVISVLEHGDDAFLNGWHFTITKR